MKASELKELLEELISKHGDKELTVLADGSVAGTVRVAYAATDGDDIIIEAEL